ncbi:MAG: hypothetical protein HC883_02175 [Bdellovibrionaceae bacterium]|nr:hypothetical protein [Pseudobdellovibrionaceae bacterium]
MAVALNDDLAQMKVQEKWELIKKETQRIWSRITDREFDEVRGDLGVLNGLIQQKYGISASDVERKLDELTAEFRRAVKGDNTNAPVDQKQDGVQATLRDQFRQF